MRLLLRLLFALNLFTAATCKVHCWLNNIIAIWFFLSFLSLSLSLFLSLSILPSDWDFSFAKSTKPKWILAKSVTPSALLFIFKFYGFFRFLLFSHFFILSFLFYFLFSSFGNPSVNDVYMFWVEEEERNKPTFLSELFHPKVDRKNFSKFCFWKVSN